MKTIQILGEPTRRSGGLLTSWATASRLPDEVLARTRERLGAVAAFIGVVGFLVVGGLVFGPIPDQFVPRFLVHNQTSLAVQAAVSMMVAIACLAEWLPVRRVLLVGLVYEVFLCALTEVAMTRASWLTFGHLPLFTWSTVIIVVFPLLVPSPPSFTLLAAVASAATGPAALIYLTAESELTATGWDVAGAAASPTLASVIAVFGAKLVYGINRDIATARELGSYRLETQLGEGGMGEVWRASHRLLARPAAVKLIRPEVLGAQGTEATRAALDRFEREAQVTATLRSAHTIGLYDFGRTDEGTFYYVMELLDGIDLGTLVTDYGPVPAERAVYLLSQVCHSLAEAHDAELVHRDIKPANIFACRHGRDLDFVKVLDFGLVKYVEQSHDDVELTAGNAVVGTPAFMAPEMATGGGVDRRADIYALGCVAFWLLTGRLVFEGKTPMAVAVAHASRMPPRTSDVTEIGVPTELDDLIAHCLAKNPSDRPQSADDLALRLSTIPLEQRWDAARSAAWWRMHRPA